MAESKKSPKFVTAQETDPITAICLNARFAGFLRKLCEQLDLDYPSVAAISGNILEEAEIQQSEITFP